MALAADWAACAAWAAWAAFWRSAWVGAGVDDEFGSGGASLVVGVSFGGIFLVERCLWFTRWYTFVDRCFFAA